MSGRAGPSSLELALRHASLSSDEPAERRKKSKKKKKKQQSGPVRKAPDPGRQPGSIRCRVEEEEISREREREKARNAEARRRMDRGVPAMELLPAFDYRIGMNESAAAWRKKYGVDQSDVEALLGQVLEEEINVAEDEDAFAAAHVIDPTFHGTSPTTSKIIELYALIMSKDVDLVRRYIAEFPDSLSQVDTLGTSPLHWAIATYHPPMIQLVFRYEGDPNRTVNKLGDTTLHLIARESQLHARESATRIIARGGDTTLKNTRGETPYSLALYQLTMHHGPDDLGYRDAVAEYIIAYTEQRHRGVPPPVSPEPVDLIVDSGLALMNSPPMSSSVLGFLLPPGGDFIARHAWRFDSMPATLTELNEIVHDVTSRGLVPNLPVEIWFLILEFLENHRPNTIMVPGGYVQIKDRRIAVRPPPFPVLSPPTKR